MIARNAKAFVAALVAFLSSIVAAKFGFELPVGIQEVLVSGGVSVVTAALTWWVPNAA